MRDWEGEGHDQFFEAELRLVEIGLFRATAERIVTTFSIMPVIRPAVYTVGQHAGRRLSYQADQRFSGV
jgi:hypothetical protein